MESPTPNVSPVPKFTGAASISPLNPHQKLGLLLGAGALAIVLIVTAVIFGGARKPKAAEAAGHDQIAHNDGRPPQPQDLGGGTTPDAGRMPGTDAGSVLNPLPPTSIGTTGTSGTSGGAGTLPPSTNTGAPGPVSVPPTHAPAPTPSVAAAGSYTVRDNDSLWSIARKTYGDARAWSLIAQANPGLNPDRLRAGSKINLPSPDAVRALLARRGSASGTTPTSTAHSTTAAGSTPTPAAHSGRPASTAVTVHEGDTLYSIARKAYGNGEKWDLIYAANKDKIRNPDELPAGIRLVIPAS